MPSTFLLGQRLSQLIDVPDEAIRRWHLFGTQPDTAASRWTATGGEDPWHPVPRDGLAQRVGDDLHRVALICDAGLGKTTNMEWLAKELAATAGPQRPLVPLLIRLDEKTDLDLLRDEAENPGKLLRRLMANVKRVCPSSADVEYAVRRWHGQGRIAILLDGLDHVTSLAEVSQSLRAILDSEHWKDGPCWIAGRPNAFESCWPKLFREDTWRFMRVEPLAEAEIRTYLHREAGGDWYEDLPAAACILSNPRLLSLLCRRLESVAATAGPDPAAQRAAVRGLRLETPADLYYLAYVDPGDFYDLNHRGLIGQGLRGLQQDLGLNQGVPATALHYPGQADRAVQLLSAVAFATYAMDRDEQERTKPRMTPVTPTELGGFQRTVYRDYLGPALA